MVGTTTTLEVLTAGVRLKEKKKKTHTPHLY